MSDVHFTSLGELKLELLDLLARHLPHPRQPWRASDLPDSIGKAVTRWRLLQRDVETCLWTKSRLEALQRKLQDDIRKREEQEQTLIKTEKAAGRAVAEKRTLVEGWRTIVAFIANALPQMDLLSADARGAVRTANHSATAEPFDHVWTGANDNLAARLAVQFVREAKVAPLRRMYAGRQRPRQRALGREMKQRISCMNSTLCAVRHALAHGVRQVFSTDELGEAEFDLRTTVYLLVPRKSTDPEGVWRLCQIAHSFDQTTKRETQERDLAAITTAETDLAVIRALRSKASCYREIETTEPGRSWHPVIVLAHPILSAPYLPVADFSGVGVVSIDLMLSTDAQKRLPLAQLRSRLKWEDVKDKASSMQIMLGALADTVVHTFFAEFPRGKK